MAPSMLKALRALLAHGGLAIVTQGRGSCDRECAVVNARTVRALIVRGLVERGPVGPDWTYLQQRNSYRYAAGHVHSVPRRFYFVTALGCQAVHAADAAKAEVL